jgi:hypothetical protein
MNSESSVGFPVVENKELYILLGEIKAQLADVRANQVRIDERQERMEKKINIAAGAIALAIFTFQAAWAYITRKA